MITSKLWVRTVVAALAAGVVLSVAGCSFLGGSSGPPVSSPSSPPVTPFKPSSLPAPTTPATPTPLTPDQAAVRVFYELRPVEDRVGQGKAKPEVLKAFMTGVVLQKRLTLYGMEWKQRGWVQKGDTKLVWVKVDQVLKVGGRRTVDVSRCLDVRPVDVVDASGKSVVEARRIPVVRGEYRVVEIRPNVWRISETISEGVKKCEA